MSKFRGRAGTIQPILVGRLTEKLQPGTTNNLAEFEWANANVRGIKQEQIDIPGGVGTVFEYLQDSLEIVTDCDLRVHVEDAQFNTTRLFMYIPSADTLETDRYDVITTSESSAKWLSGWYYVVTTEYAYNQYTGAGTSTAIVQWIGSTDALEETGPIRYILYNQYIHVGDPVILNPNEKSVNKLEIATQNLSLVTSVVTNVNK